MPTKTSGDKFLSSLVLFVFVAASLLSPFSPGTQVSAHSTAALAATSALGGKVTYDLSGNLATRQDGRGLVTNYEYDNGSRLTAIRYADNTAVSFTYDAANQRTSMQDPLGKTSYQYDIHGQLNQEVDALGQDLRFEYEPRGLIARMTFPDGSQVIFQWDENGWLSSVQDSQGETTYKYDLAGRVTDRILPNGIHSTYQYDSAGRLASLRHLTSQGSLVLGFSYQFDAAGNRNSIIRQNIDGDQQTNYGYDSLYRLVSVTYADGEQVTYSYDASGNRTSQVSSKTGAIQYTYNGLGQLTQASNGQTITAYQYDNAGNLVERTRGSETARYTWDNENRLTGYQSAAATLTFGYDGSGRRLLKTANGVKTQYLQSTGDLVRLLAAKTDQETTRILPGLPAIGETSGKSAIFYLEDGLGSIVGLADPSGKLTSSIQYDAFGQPRNGASLPALLGFA